MAHDRDLAKAIALAATVGALCIASALSPGCTKAPPPPSPAPSASAIATPPSPSPAAPSSAPAPELVGPFKKAKATVFWVGEAASKENGWIQNVESAWQGKPDHWMKHHGCADTEKTPCSGAKENPFYCALPLQDLDDGRVKSAVAGRIPAAWRENPPKSSLKNRWIAVRAKGKTGYCQWEDVGPWGEDDVEWVFGKATKPKQSGNESAGLDLSPALANYLGVSGVYDAEFALVLYAAEVPPGPWRAKTTSSGPSQ